VDIQGFALQKVCLDDIDIAHMMFGNDNPILLISGSNNVMDVWPSSVPQELSSNHKAIVFDRRVTGTEDVAVPAAKSLILVQKIPGAWLVQIEE
jgi:hypothetical protein